jgi:glycosyltransferase involved in cell wall biosynthesis
MSTPPPQRPRLILAAANNIVADVRVRKYVETAVQAGADVTVLGIAAGRTLERGVLGGAQLIRVPVTYQLRDAATRAHLPATRSAALELEGRRRKAAQRDVSADIGALKAASRTAHRLERRAIARQIARLRDDADASRVSFDQHVNIERASIKQALSMHEDSIPLVEQDRLPSDWRAYAPEFLDLELAFGPVLDKLEADVLHAHDVHLLATMARSKRRRAGAGQRTTLIYDAHEFIPGLFHTDPAYVDALASMEAEFIPDCDSVVTVSPRIATELQHLHQLDAPATLVTNAPVVDFQSVQPDIRTLIGLDENATLVVYSGGVNPGRGLEVVIDALARLRHDHHLAIVTNRPGSKYTNSLRLRANHLGVGTRFHVVDFVPPERVVTFLAGADIGVHPMRPGWRNHDWALPNKVFEYAAAGLALVVSDLEEMARFVTDDDLGTTFLPGDADDLARAIRSIAEKVRSREPGTTRSGFTWSDQARAVVDLYRRASGAILIDNAPQTLPPVRWPDAEAAAATPAVETVVISTPHIAPDAPPVEPTSTARLAIGPMNAAGQAWVWARAVEAAGAAAAAEVFQVDDGSVYEFQTDHLISTRDWSSLDWQLRQTQRILSRFTHVLFEFGRPMLGRLQSQHFDADARMMAAHRIATGIICHGSDVRDPDLHASLEPHSPFRTCDPALRSSFAGRTKQLRQMIREVGLPAFVTTIGLLDSVPHATWLPLALDLARLPPRAAAPGQTSGPLRVGHFPTNGLFKGSGAVDAVCERLQDDGLITYQRLSGVSRREIPANLEQIDVLIDGVVLGDYGVLACEAMAVGTPVVGNVSDRVRDRLPQSLPIVDADPDTLDHVLRRLVNDRDQLPALSRAGRDYVTSVHDGRASVAVLRGFLSNGS